MFHEFSSSSYDVPAINQHLHFILIAAFNYHGPDAFSKTIFLFIIFNEYYSKCFNYFLMGALHFYRFHRNNGTQCPAEDVSQQQFDRTASSSQCCKYRNVLKISHWLLHSLNFFRIFKLIYLFTEKYKLSHRNVERDRTRDYKCTLMQMRCKCWHSFKFIGGHSEIFAGIGCING